MFEMLEVEPRRKLDCVLRTMQATTARVARETPMLYTLFYSRLRSHIIGPEKERYDRDVQAMLAIVRSCYSGFVDTKTFTAEDGERLTVVRFADAESQLGWARDAQHVRMQQRGRTDYYDAYRLVICEEKRSSTWTRTDATSALADGELPA
jgi:heme-degrading monooxygenase HmoA